MTHYTTRRIVYNNEQTALGRVTLAGYIRHGSGVQGMPRILGSYALVYLIEGSGWYRDPQRPEQRLRSGDLLLIQPDIAHTYGPWPGDTWSEFYCVFDGPAFDLLRDIGLLAVERTLLHLAEIDSWLARIEAALPDPAAITHSERTIALSRFIQLVTEIAAVGHADSRPTAPAWIAEACRLLRRDLAHDTPPASVAAQLGVPYETFRKLFQQAVGTSPARYRMTRRIDAACGLLLETDLTIYTIAERLGFANEFHFSRRFKQITGAAPRDFRRQMPQTRRAETASGSM
ncbi:MAG TPA: AraC family transcriptional regulator [Roseiflexaceae bacterium]|nr:AraC family transcriptional regulator [Roseiflexaceae bacterium]HMP41378.1 AraC family transcriptional regulator [Roseiflexaceae bacterium]